MNFLRSTVLLPIVFLCSLARAEPLVIPKPEARRIEVLFFGAPTANSPAHDPATRYRVLKKYLGTKGINFTYSENPAEALNSDTLAQYDALLMYGNWEADGEMPAPQLKALTTYVEGGGGFMPIHCASNSFGGSPEFVKLVGAHFKEHSEGVFKVDDINPTHPIMAGYPGYEAWDETRVHDQPNSDLTVLETRDVKPWSWVREQGKGRVFYTSAGHDHKVWDLPEFQDLITRAIRWSVGPEKSKLLDTLALPKLEEEDAKLPGYLKRKLITKAQKPLSAADSMKLAQIPPGFELALFAAEPDIVNPIFVNWDSKGRAYIIQTVDYPNNLHSGNLGNDKISIAEDTDHDGRADKFTTFADKLSIPTSLAFANGGLICTNGPDMIFLKDTDGDDKADVRKVLFTGFGMGDTHAGVSNLVAAPDGWIYATVGYSGFGGTVGGEKFSFSQTVFRFKPDGSKMEALQDTTNNTWGLGITPDFDIMGSTANANPSFYLTFPQAEYDAADLQAPRTPRADNNPIFNPSSADIRQVDQFDRYTAGAGHAFYTSTRFPESWRNTTAFVCEPTGKLVGVFDTRREGGGFKSNQRYNNLYNSADAWSAPVCAETGPDGAVWICDWYNLIIQHNPQPSKSSSGLDATTGKGNAYETPLRDTQFGRIYRVYPKASADDTNPGLDPAKPETLIAGLEHPNLFWRLQAQRLLVERGDKDVVPALVKLSRTEGIGASHALHALASLGSLDPDLITNALKSPVRAILRAGIKLATPEQLKTAYLTGGGLASLEPRELAEAMVGISHNPPSPEIGAALFDFLIKNEQAVSGDRVMKDAWQIAANHQDLGTLMAAARAGFDEGEEAAPSKNLLPNPDFSAIKDGLPENWNRLRTHSGATAPEVKMSSSPDGRDGTDCLRIESPELTDSGPFAPIRVQRQTRYRLTGWIRTEKVIAKDDGPGAILYISGIGKSGGVKGTSGWTKVTMDFNSDDNSTISVMCLFGGYGGATGTAWFDDVSLNEIGGGSGAKGMVRDVKKHFLTHASPADRATMTKELPSIAGDYSKRLLVALQDSPASEGPKAKKFAPDAEVHARGKQIYALTCIACHQPDAKGMAGAFPPLDGSDWLTGDPSIPIRVLLHGLSGPITVAGQDYNSVMPAHANLDDRAIADVLTHVRQIGSNDAAPVSEKEVAATRAKYQERTAPWTAPELVPAGAK